MTPPDVVFDDRADDFERGIYGTSKGGVRLKVLWADLTESIPGLVGGALNIADVGAGTGHISLKAAERGHRLTLCDPSNEMLRIARDRFNDAGVSDATFVVGNAHDLIAQDRGPFDIVFCHAVLEWLEEPRRLVPALSELLANDGHFSLMFYNENAAILKRVMRGELAPAPSGAAASGEGPWPLNVGDVERWLEEAGFNVVSRAGIRIFHDLAAPEARSEENLPRLIALETAYRCREPFASLAQHIHLVCRKR